MTMRPGVGFAPGGSVIHSPPPPPPPPPPVGPPGNPLDIFNEMLEESPEAAFFSFANQWGGPSQTRFFQNQFRNIFNEFLGWQGQQLRAGAMPEQRFSQWLGNMPWTQRFAALSPELRGMGSTAQFNPFAQWRV